MEMIGFGGRLDLQADEFLDGTNTATSSTSDKTLKAAQGGGYRIYVGSVVVSNKSNTFTTVAIKSGSTTKATIAAPAAGGQAVRLDPPIRCGDNEALSFATADSVDSVVVSFSGFKGR